MLHLSTISQCKRKCYNRLDNNCKDVNDRTGMKYTIPKIKMLCNLRRLKVRLRLLSTAQQPELRFKTAKVMQHFYFWNGVLLTRVTVDFNDLKVLPST